jgi:hypothetical protein
VAERLLKGFCQLPRAGQVWLLWCDSNALAVTSSLVHDAGVSVATIEMNEELIVVFQ